MQSYTIIPAAGSGKRFGGPKQFRTLAGLPLWVHAVLPFQHSPLITGICVTVPEPDLAETKKIVHSEGLTKVMAVVAGGNERQDSVKNGLAALPSCDVVVIHDGVRPFVTEAEIQETIRVASEVGACVVGMPTRDTTKKVDASGRVIETLDRSSLRSIQTPQAFRYSLLKKAFEAAGSFVGTDEAMLVERLGEPVQVMMGSPQNIKITAPEDWVVAEAIFAERQAKLKKRGLS